MFKKRHATQITGSGLEPLLKLKRMQAKRRAKTLAALKANRVDDTMAVISCQASFN